MSSSNNTRYTTKVEPLLFNEQALRQLFPAWEFRRASKRYISSRDFRGNESSDSDKTYILPQGGKYSHITVGENSTGNPTKTLYEFYADTRGYDCKRDSNKIYTEIAAAVGITFFDEKAMEQMAKYEKKQRELKAYFKEMREALYTLPEAAATLQYLRGTDYEGKQERGYSDEYIKHCPFGYLSASMPCYKEVIKLLTYKTGKKDDRGQDILSKPAEFEDKATGEKKGVGYTNTFVIAYCTDGDFADPELSEVEVKGFEFRAPFSDEEIKAKGISKYYSAFTSASDTQKYALFGLSGLRFNASDRLTIVEGELDQCRGKYAGIPNLAAVSQGRITPEQIEQAKAYGVKAITLLMDTEKLYTEAELREKGETDPAFKRLQNEEAVEKLIRETLLPQGLRVYVAYLPSPEGRKVDLDSYLRGIEGSALKEKGAEVTKMIEEAEGAFTFMYRRMQARYAKEEQTPYNRERFEEEVIALVSDPRCSATEEDSIFSLMESYTGRSRAQAIRDRADRQTAERDRKQQAEALQKALSNALKDKAADPQHSIAALQKQLNEIDKMRGESELSSYLNIETLEEEKAKRKGKKKGIKTDFTFYAKRGSDSRELILPSKAITYVCAPTSHGKTRLLENLALQVTKNDEEEGVVLFISMEEDSEAVRDEFLNIFCNKELSANNLRQIADYRARGEAAKEYFRSGMFHELQKAEKELYSNYIDTGKLRIIYEETCSINKIKRAVRKLKNTLLDEDPQGKPIKAVFIDYVQRIKKRESKGDRKQELSDITDDLMSLSIEIDAPFVIAVQLSREAYSPLEIDVQTIANASEIEQSGNIVMLCWNSSFPARAKSSLYYYKGKEGKERNLTEDAIAFESRNGIHLGQEGRFYAILAKNRGDLRDIEAVFEFNGNTGAMRQASRPQGNQSDNTSQEGATARQSKKAQKKEEAKQAQQELQQEISYEIKEEYPEGMEPPTAEEKDDMPF